MGTALPRRWFAVLATMAGACALVLLSGGGDAMAHPQGDTSINRYVRVELYEGRAHIHYVLDYSEIPTLFWEFNVDADADGEIKPAERAKALRAFEQELTGGLGAWFSGEGLELRLLDSSIELFEGDMGLRVLRVALAFEALVEADEPGELTVEDRNYEGRSGWRTMAVRPSPGTMVTMDASLEEDPSAALTLFPDEWALFPPMTWTVSIGWDPTTGETAPGSVALDRWRPEGSSAWGRLLKRDGPWWMLAVALMLAFGFGALDALGPGHGKAIVGSYIASSGAGRGEAVALGLVAGGTHTMIVLALAFAALRLGPAILGPETGAYLVGGAGVLIVGVGIALAWHHWRGHPDQAHEGVRGRGGLVAVGIAGGMVPCPASILVLLAAISGGDLGYGFALIAAFGLGMGSVLIAVGLAVMGMGRAWQRPRLAAIRESRMGSIAAAAIPVVSGAVVALAGAVLVLSAVAGSWSWAGTG